MQDRVSLYPGRVKLEPVAGQANLYDLTRADQPTQEGTPLNKASLLSDATAALLGLGTDAVPDEAFLALAIGSGYYGYRVKVQFSDGTPAEGVTVTGISALSGSSLVTDQDGLVVGRSSSASVTIGCTSPYVDQNAPASQAVTASGTVTGVTITLTRVTGEIEITSSTVVAFSPEVLTYDLCAVGAGAGGLYVSTGAGVCGAAGGGGAVANLLGVSAPAHRTIAVSVGSGSAKASNTTPTIPDATYTGDDGGNTTISSQVDGSLLLSAAGGKGGSIVSSSSATYRLRGVGGTGNGAGGATKTDGTVSSDYSSDGGSCVASGTNATGYKFNDSSLGIPGGGGGSVSVDTLSRYFTGSRPSKGSPNGGWSGQYKIVYNGDKYINTLIAAAQDAGVGGGGQVTDGSDENGASYNGTGAGGNGKVYIRCHFAA